METIDDKYEYEMARMGRQYKIEMANQERQFEIEMAQQESQWEKGNIQCKTCGRMYAASAVFNKCPHCCPHNELRITDQWTGSEPRGHGWAPDFICVECGKDYGWSLTDLKINYKIIRK